MTKATGNECCTRCAGSASEGEDLVKESGALFHVECYEQLRREERALACCRDLARALSKRGLVALVEEAELHTVNDAWHLCHARQANRGNVLVRVLDRRVVLHVDEVDDAARRVLALPPAPSMDAAWAAVCGHVERAVADLCRALRAYRRAADAAVIERAKSDAAVAREVRITRINVLDYLPQLARLALYNPSEDSRAELLREHEALTATAVAAEWLALALGARDDENYSASELAAGLSRDALRDVLTAKEGA